MWPWVYCWTLFCSVDLEVCFLCQWHTVLITVVLQYCLKSAQGMPPALFFFLRITLAILCLLWFNVNFRIILILWKVMGDLIGIALNLWIALSIMAILTVLVLIQEHQICFHFLESSTVFFIFSFIMFVRVIPRFVFFFWWDFKCFFF